MTRDGWQDNRQNDLISRETEYCDDLLKKAAPANLPEDITREMDSIVERAIGNFNNRGYLKIIFWPNLGVGAII